MRSALSLAVAALAVTALAFWWLTRPVTLAPGDLPAHRPDPVNGQRLFHAGGCTGCHGERLAGGEEMRTPFGIFRVPNITPDETGIGGWSTLDFVNAMNRGVSPDGRHYYPAFPYASYTRMNLADLIDLKAWLDTYESVGNTVGAHTLRFPWNLRRGIGLWKRRYLDSRPVVRLDRPTAELERGRYLVESAGHCGECHTPRDRFGGPVLSRWLAGAPDPEGEGRVPDLTPGGGLAEWSARDIAWYLKSGFTPDFDTVGGSMVRVQENLARLRDEDRAAIAAYLKALPGAPASGHTGR